MAITIEGIHHAGLLVSDLERAIAFYEGVLGLAPLARPELGFAGRWYDLYNGQQLHLMCVEKVPGHHDPPRHDRHLALTVASLDATEAELRRQGVEIGYGSGRSGRPQLFIRDPDGNTIELRAGDPSGRGGDGSGTSPALPRHGQEPDQTDRTNQRREEP